MKPLIRLGGLLFLLLLGWLPVASAQTVLDKVVQINVTNVGPQNVGDALVRANIHLKVGDTYIRTSVDKDVVNLMATGFFRNIKVAEQRTDDGIIVTYLLEGKPRLLTVNFEGNAKYSNAKLKKKISSREGDPVNDQKLFSDTMELEKLYEKAGYTGTKVKYELINVDLAAGHASVLFTIHETSKVKITDIEFVGARAFTQKVLRKTIKTRKHWMFSWLTSSGVFKEDQFADDKEALSDFYHNAGYIDFELQDVKITNPTPKTMRIEFIVSEGSQYKVGTVSFKGNKLFSLDEIVAGLKKQHADKRLKTVIGVHGLEADSGLTFKPEALKTDLQALEDFYGSRGYIRANNAQSFNLRVVKIPNTETGTLDLDYQIDEGEKSYVEKIEIKGNVKTKDKVIRRELSISPGDVFDMVLVKLSKERVEYLGFFEEGKVETKVEPTEVSNHKNLIIGVEEKRTAEFTAGAGFDTIDSLVGYVQFEQRNFDLFNPPTFTGAGQKLRLRVQLGLEREDYTLSFVEPWFLNRKLVLGVDLYRSVLNFQSLNSLYNEVLTGAKFSLTRDLGSENFRGTISYAFRDVGITDINTNAPEAIYKDSGYTMLHDFGAGLSFDTRNSVQLPTKGQQTQLLGDIVVGDREYFKLEAKTQWYLKGFAPGHVIELGGKFGVAEKLTGQDVPFFDRFYLGGQDTLRGYDYRAVGPRVTTLDGLEFEPIGGDTYWMGTAEYSIPIIEHLRLAFFYDIGNVSADPFSFSGSPVVGRSFNTGAPFLRRLTTTPVVGTTGSFSDNYGIGIRLNLPIGPLRLDYGIPVHHDSFSGSGGKFQFGVGFSRPL